MHEHERNTPKASTAFAGAGPHACLIGQKSRLSRWLPRLLLLAIGVVGPATLLLRCTPADAQNTTIHCNKKSPRSSSRWIISSRKPSPLMKTVAVESQKGGSVACAGEPGATAQARHDPVF
jgi:hypothetical protein